ncbi:dihydrodipicolinate synthase family protein [Paraburkholderia terrae]|uniref:dihydrodipicolinate synthase family protein n=1 Tax=Paraburkholderia terrae TaxID=311230 RepID=UPI0005A99EF6|nr:dihydrodipicolinate synthase family protein [Paraburkholderia terrae]
MNSFLPGAAPTPLWAAIHTPFQSSLELDEAGLRHNARRYVELGLRGVFCNGLMGEVWALSLEERKRIVEILCNEGCDRLGVAVVITAASVNETVDLGRHAKASGVDHAVLMVPTSGPRSDEQQLAYFRLICERLDMPIVLFNAATAAGTALSPASFAKVCEIPQVTMLKSTAYRENLQLRAAARNGVVVSDPLEEHYLRNRLDHGQRILYADPEPYLYQVPGYRPIADYVAKLDAGLDAGEVMHEHEALSPLRSVFNKWVMDPLISGHMPNAALKHWCELIGLAGGPVRAPVQPLSGAQARELERDLVRCHAPGLNTSVLSS